MDLIERNFCFVKYAGQEKRNIDEGDDDVLPSGSLLVEVGYLAKHVLDGWQQYCFEVFEDDFAEAKTVFIGSGIRKIVHH